MSSEAIKQKVENVINDLIIAVATETRREVTADINERLQKSFGGGFSIHFNGEEGQHIAAQITDHVNEPKKSTKRLASHVKKQVTATEKPKKKRKMTPKFRAAMERNLAKARAQRARNLKAQKKPAGRRNKKK